MKPKNKAEIEALKSVWLNRHLYNPLPITMGKPRMDTTKRRKKGL